MKININIKKLTPTLSLGAAAATAAPLIAMQGAGSKHSIVINNLTGSKPLPLNALNKDASVEDTKTINISGLQELKIDSNNPLESVLKQYLPQSSKYGAWVDNEKKLLSSSIDNPSSTRSIKSEIFKAAKKAIQDNMKVTGQVTHEACQKAYQAIKSKVKNKNLIDDIWNYCHINRKAVKRTK